MALAGAAAGCGGGLPPAAEPADSPSPTNRPAGEIFRVGEMPEGLAFDSVSRLLFVGLRDPGRLALINPRTGAIIRLLPLPAPPRHLAAGTGGEVLVPAEDANSLVEVSPSGMLVRETPVGEHPHDAAAAGGRIFVSDEFADTVSVVQGGRTIRSLDAPQQPGGIAAVADRYVAVVAVRERVLEAYDARSFRPVGQIDAGDGPTHIVSLGDSVLVADTDGNALLRFRLEPQPKLVGRTELSGTPYGLAFDARRRLVWVTQTALNRVEVLRVGPRGLRRIAGYPTLRQPNSVAVDPESGDAFVAGRAADAVERIAPPRPGGGE